jgi:hypothetical protein
MSMTHEIFWMKVGSVLYVSYQEHQTRETILACLDDMAHELDKAETPVMVLINWNEVTNSDTKALFSVSGHRAFSHPMAARGILVGMPKQTRLENEVAAVKTRQSKNTQYYDTMDEALEYLHNFLEDASGLRMPETKADRDSA